MSFTIFVDMAVNMMHIALIGSDHEEATADLAADRNTAPNDLPLAREKRGEQRRMREMAKINKDVSNIKEAIEALRILQFSGNALNQIVEGVKGSMEHGTWRDDKGMRLKDTNEWAVFYTTFKNSVKASAFLNENKHLIFAAADLFAACEAAWFPLNVMYRHKPGSHGFEAIETIWSALSKADGRKTSAEHSARRIPTAIEALQAIANLPTGNSEDEMNGQESAYRAVEALFASQPYIKAGSGDLLTRLAGHCQCLIDLIDDVQTRCGKPIDDEDMVMVRHIESDAQSTITA